MRSQSSLPERDSPGHRVLSNFYNLREIRTAEKTYSSSLVEANPINT